MASMESMGLHGNENGLCMDESLEREMGMRGVSGSEGYVHGNENGFAWEWEWEWEWEWACMDGNGFAWMRV